MISLDVVGKPAPKGSMRAILVRGHAVLIPGGSSVNQRELIAWARAVRDRATEAIGSDNVPMYVDIALEVGLVFRVERPRGHFGTGKNASRLLASAPAHPSVKPDIDKLARATLDALTGVLFDDDARIAVLTVVKQWGSPSGVTITLRPVPPLQPLLFAPTTQKF